MLKGLVDTQLFLTFLICFILRVLPEIHSDEPFGVAFYGWFLVVSMVSLVCAAVVLTARRARRRRKFRERLLEGPSGMGIVDFMELEVLESPAQTVARTTNSEEGQGCE